MKCVVPLAGPDLLHPTHGLRPLRLIEGRPLLSLALEERPWRAALAPEDYVFVVREVEGLDTLTDYLSRTWPGSAIVTLSGLTEGALLSALAGLPLAGGEGPLLIDLADILFEADFDLPALFTPGVGAVVPCFTSSESCYSYLRSEDGRVVEAAEKRVISDAASAGVYAFRDRGVFLRAAAHSLEHRAALVFKGALFVCPAVNGVIADGLETLAPPVHAVRPIGKLFHEEA